jgi:ferredoxin
VDEVASLAVAVVGGLCTVVFVVFGLISLDEREPRAARVSFWLAAATGLASAAFALLPAPASMIFLIVFAGGLVVAGFVLAGPIGRETAFGGRPSRRVDERDIMFARGRLVPGSPEYEAYYFMRPQHLLGDDLTRSLPGLLSPDAELADEVVFAAAEAGFDLTEAVRHSVDGEVAGNRVERSPEQWTAILKEYARSYGAVDVGVAKLQPYHVYTHIGRGTGVYGAPVELDHRWALAFTVEMDHGRIGHAPAAPVVEESARQYVEGAKVALILAAMIRRLGYPARAHIDGNYRVIAPLVARDAGLGEIGRMGLLMTPRLGPRVRLGVVTTDLPLVADAAGDDASVLDFCTICRKCAVNCPVAAIPSGERSPIDGGLRWAIDSESCFRYWNLVGTDCATCVRICPYSHPDTAAHNLVRWSIGRSAAARRAMLWMDDVFYGKKVKSIAKIKR